MGRSYLLEDFWGTTLNSVEILQSLGIFSYHEVVWFWIYRILKILSLRKLCEFSQVLSL